MAAAVPLSTPARQPFGSISGARLRNLGNTKNKQNALSSSSSSTSSFLKSSSPQIFNDIDSENIDPATFTSSTKSSKTLQSHSDLKTSSSSTMQHFRRASFVLSKAITAPTTQLASAAGQKRNLSDVVDFTLAASDRPIKALRTTPAAPAPAGRSPKSKRTGILSRRRISANPFTRVDPPSFGANKNALPLSIDAALSGTLPSYKPKQYKPAPSVHDYLPKGWQFMIHEDSKDEESSNLMEHRTCTLDLSSDDESRAAARDDRGKENIPPVDGMNAPVRASTALPASRKDMMTDGARSPLGDLNAKDFYADGCDANSFFIVPTEGSSDSNVEKSNIVNEANANYYPADSLTTANIDAVIAASGSAMGNYNAIDIWESGSAKAENAIAA